MSRLDKMHAGNLRRNPCMAPETAERAWRRVFRSARILVLFCLALATPLRADTISGTVKDPSGAVVVGARIEITGGELSQALVLTSDATGKFTAPNLRPGGYSIRVVKDGFEELVTGIELKGEADIPLSLTIAEQQAEVNVTDKATMFANSRMRQGHTEHGCWNLRIRVRYDYSSGRYQQI